MDSYCKFKEWGYALAEREYGNRVFTWAQYDRIVAAQGQEAADAAQKAEQDLLDLENWRLTRHLFDQGRIRSSSAPLNNVLDYSGH